MCVLLYFWQLHDPTTLTCGHTACRRCLALWYSISGAAAVRCPAGCSSKLPPGLPATNIVLKQKVQRSFPKEYARRSTEVAAAEADKPVLSSIPAIAATTAVPQFRRRVPPNNNNNNNNIHVPPVVARFFREVRPRPFTRQQVRMMAARLVLAFVLYVFARMVGAWWGSAASQPPASATAAATAAAAGVVVPFDDVQVATWSPDQVLQWLDANDLTATCAATFKDRQIDGAQLAAIDDDMFDELRLPIAFLRKHEALLAHVSAVQTAAAATTSWWRFGSGSVQWTSFWDWRHSSRYHGTLLLVLFTLSPRLAFLYIRWLAPSRFAEFYAAHGLFGGSMWWSLLAPAPAMLAVAFNVAGLHLRSLLPGVVLFQHLLAMAQAELVGFHAQRHRTAFQFGQYLGKVYILPTFVALGAAVVLFCTWPVMPWMLTDLLVYAFFVWVYVAVPAWQLIAFLFNRHNA